MFFSSKRSTGGQPESYASPLTPASCLLPPPETTGFLGEMIVNVRSAWESTVKDIVPEHRMQGVETFLENLRANQRLCS